MKNSVSVPFLRPLFFLLMFFPAFAWPGRVAALSRSNGAFPAVGQFGSWAADRGWSAGFSAACPVSAGKGAMAIGPEPRAAEGTGKSSRSDRKAWIPMVLADKTFGLEVERMFIPQGVKPLRDAWLFLVREGRVQAELPYVGRFSSPNLSIAHRQLVDIDGLLFDYQVDTLRRGAYRVKFKVQQVGETFEAEMRIGRDAYTTLYLRSGMRSEIRYSGMLKIVPGWEPREAKPADGPER